MNDPTAAKDAILLEREKKLIVQTDNSPRPEDGQQPEQPPVLVDDEAPADDYQPEIPS
jgi:hypothetical protein